MIRQNGHSICYMGQRKQGVKGDCWFLAMHTVVPSMAEMAEMRYKEKVNDVFRFGQVGFEMPVDSLADID